MSFHSATTKPDQTDQKKVGLRTFAAEFWLASLPVLSTMVTISYFGDSFISARYLIGLLFICSLLLLLKRARLGLSTSKLASPAFSLGFVFWYAYPALINALSEGEAFGLDLPLRIDNYTVLLTILYISLFQLSWVIISNLSTSVLGSPRKKARWKMQISPSRIVLLALIAVFVGLLPYFTSGLSLPEVLQSIVLGRTEGKEWLYLKNLGNSESSFLYLSQSALIAGVCTLWFISFQGSLPKPYRVFFLCLAILLSALISFDTGTRSLTALILLPPMGYQLTKLWQQSRRQAVLFALALGIFMFFLLQFQLLYRVDRTRMIIGDLFFENAFTLGGTIDYFKESLLAVRAVPAVHDYFRESIVVQFISFPIPRFIWAEKPVSQVTWFYTYLRWGIDLLKTDGNVFPGIVGQYYMSWGWIGPILAGSALGLITSVLDERLPRAVGDKGSFLTMIHLLLAVWIFISFRVVSPGYAFPVLFAVTIVFFSGTKSFRGRSG